MDTSVHYWDLFRNVVVRERSLFPVIQRKEPCFVKARRELRVLQNDCRKGVGTINRLRSIQSRIFYLYVLNVIIRKKGVQAVILIVKFFVVIHQERFINRILTEARTIYRPIVVMRIPFVT